MNLFRWYTGQSTAAYLCVCMSTHIFTCLCVCQWASVHKCVIRGCACACACVRVCVLFVCPLRMFSAAGAQDAAVSCAQLQ